MTIAAAYLTSEGVVFGADSKTTYSAGQGVAQLLDHAQKIYEIGERGRYGLCTFGLGKIGDLSHRTIAAKVSDIIAPKPTATLDDVVDALVTTLSAWAATLTSTPNSSVGYFVGGVDLNRTPRCARVFLSFATNPTTGGTTYQVARDDLTIGTAWFDGAPDYFSRIFHGFAPGLPDAVRDALKKEVPNLPPDFDQRFLKAFGDASRTFVSAGVTDLPLREAIDYVHTYLHITVKAFKFRVGPPPCGGPLEVAYISTDRTFRWAKHKLFDSAIRENETWTR